MGLSGKGRSDAHPTSHVFGGCGRNGGQLAKCRKLHNWKGTESLEFLPTVEEEECCR